MNLLESMLQGIKNMPSAISSAFDDNIPETPRMLGSYLGSWEKDPYNYSVSRLRDSRTIKSGEVLNQQRLLDALATTNKLRRKKANNRGYDPGRYSLADMRDGDNFELDDYYDVDKSSSDGFRNRDFDLSASLGSFKLRSKSNLRFIKFGDKLLPYGSVEHGIANEKYDFHPGKSPDGTFDKALENMGWARPYPVKATWKTYPLGVIKIGNDGKRDRSGVEWGLLR